MPMRFAVELGPTTSVSMAGSNCEERVRLISSSRMLGTAGVDVVGMDQWGRVGGALHLLDGVAEEAQGAPDALKIGVGSQS